MKFKQLFVAALLGGVSIEPASAQISIAGTASGAYDSTSLTGSISYSLQGAGNTLVFGTYLDAGYTASNVQFGGVAANGVVQDQRALLAYFYNPASSGNITFSLSAGSVNSAFFIYELIGVNTLTPGTTGTGASITTTGDNAFVVNFIGANNTDGSGPLTPAASSIATLSGVANANGAIGGGSIGAAFASDAGAAGVKTLGWTGLGGGFAQGEVSAAFSPLVVPEPSASAMILTGVGALMFARRRLV